jgi:hypothetical protein
VFISRNNGEEAIRSPFAFPFRAYAFSVDKAPRIGYNEKYRILRENPARIDPGGLNMIGIKKTGAYTKEPSPREVLGCFIESGFGRQVSGLWAEMIYNRSLREVPPYKNPTWEWLGLDREHYNADAPFWHSGYEECGWDLLDGTGSYLTVGTETHKGTQCRILSGKSGEPPYGIRQEGIHLEKGREYVFLICCGSGMWRSDPGLNGFVSKEHPLETRPLNIRLGADETVLGISGNIREYAWTFAAAETGVFPLTISFAWQGDLILPWVSLMPADNLRGWRADAVRLIREAGPTVVRFPGGCFTSFYNWRSSVGPRNRRDPQESFYWGGLEENDVGLAEFLELSGLCGFEAQICFNMMTSTPFDAMCMTEYLNAPPDTGYGRLRASDGHPEPYGVKYFECDNEPNRKWTAVEYAGQCVEFARAMRTVSPDAKFLFAAYGYSLELLPAMLGICGADMDYIIYRRGDPDFVGKILPVLREYNAKTGRDLKLVNTEWLPPCRSPEPFDEEGIRQDFSWNGRITNDYNDVFSRHQISWNYALNGAHRLLDYISYGGEFALANFNNMANTWGQNLVEASKDGAWLSCMGEVFALFKRQYRISFSCPAETGDPLLFGLFTKDPAGAEKLWIVNHGSAAKEIALPEGFSRSADGLTADRRSAHVTETDKPVKRIAPRVRDGRVTLPGLSVVVFE